MPDHKAKAREITRWFPWGSKSAPAAMRDLITTALRAAAAKARREERGRIEIMLAEAQQDATYETIEGLRQAEKMVRADAGQDGGA